MLLFHHHGPINVRLSFPAPTIGMKWASWKYQMHIHAQCLKKNLNTSRPSEHPPVRGKMSKRLGGIVGCKIKEKTSSWHLIGFPVKSTMPRRNPTFYCSTLTSIAMQRHQAKRRQKSRYTMSLDYSSMFYIGFRIGWVSALFEEKSERT